MHDDPKCLLLRNRKPQRWGASPGRPSRQWAQTSLAECVLPLRRVVAAARWWGPACTTDRLRHAVRNTGTSTSPLDRVPHERKPSPGNHQPPRPNRQRGVCVAAAKDGLDSKISQATACAAESERASYFECNSQARSSRFDPEESGRAVLLGMIPESMQAKCTSRVRQFRPLFVQHIVYGTVKACLRVDWNLAGALGPHGAILPQQFGRGHDEARSFGPQPT